MDLGSIFRSAVATADQVARSAQVAVSHEAWTGADNYSKPTYAAAVSRLAVVSMKQRMRRMPDGREVVQRAVVTFVGPVAANGAAGRREPVDPRDRITLPSGFTGPILDVEGAVDPATGAPYTVKVTLGGGA